MPPVRTARKNSSTRKAQQPRMKNLARVTTKDVSMLRSPLNSAEARPAGALANSNTPPEIPRFESMSASSSALALAPSPPKKHVDAFGALRSVSKGEKEVHFVSDREWEEGWQNKLAARTKKLSFGYGFVLTDQHIEHLASLGSGVCRSLTHFEFLHSDVSYDAHNANELTDDTTVRLAHMCPSLRVVKLQGVHASRLTDATLIAFLSNCLNLTSIEVTGHEAAGTIKEASFDALREHPDWAPKLRTLRIPQCRYVLRKDEDRWMKAMRALSRERETLLIEVVSVSQVKKWGDWELETLLDKYRKGKVQRRW